MFGGVGLLNKVDLETVLMPPRDKGVVECFGRHLGAVVVVCYVFPRAVFNDEIELLAGVGCADKLVFKRLSAVREVFGDFGQTACAATFPLNGNRTFQRHVEWQTEIGRGLEHSRVVAVFEFSDYIRDFLFVEIIRNVLVFLLSRVDKDNHLLYELVDGRVL